MDTALQKGIKDLARIIIIVLIGRGEHVEMSASNLVHEDDGLFSNRLQLISDHE